MPSPGAVVLQNELEGTYTVEGGFDTTFKSDYETAKLIGEGLDAGWTAEYPTTPSSFTAALPASIASLGSGGGIEWMSAVGTGLDAEVTLWVASWLPPGSGGPVHTYAPNSSAAVATARATYSGTWSAGMEAIAQKICDAFISFWVQEGA